MIATGGSDEKLEVVKQQALGKGRFELALLLSYPGPLSALPCHSLSNSKLFCQTNLNFGWIQKFVEGSASSVGRWLKTTTAYINCFAFVNVFWTWTCQLWIKSINKCAFRNIGLHLKSVL